MELFTRRPSQKDEEEPCREMIESRLSRISQLTSAPGHDYAQLERKIQKDCYLDRIIVVKTLCGDQDPRAVGILEWLMHNGKDRTKNGVIQDERSLAADALGRTGGEYALSALKRAIGKVDIQIEVRQAIAQILERQKAAESIV